MGRKAARARHALTWTPPACPPALACARADGFLTRVRTEAHAVGDVDPDEDEEGEEDFDDEDEEGEFGEGAPAAYRPSFGRGTAPPP